MAQLAANLDDNLTIDLAFESLEAIVLLVVEKIGHIGMKAHDDIFAVLQTRLLLLDRSQ